MHDCSGEPDSDGYETPPASSGPPRPKCENGESESAFQTNEICCSWWLKLSEKSREKRINCIRIHVLSPFLFGVVPPGQNDKMIDWSYECGLLPDKDIQQTVSLAYGTFASIHVVECAFFCLADSCNSKERIINILNLKDEFIKLSSVDDAIQCSEKFEWFKTMRSRITLMAKKERKEMGDMSLLLAIYHFAGHVQLTVNEYDVLQRYEEDCKLAEEKALELKFLGNKEFAAELYRSSISFYSRAVGLSPFNYIVYGNRAQSYLKVGQYRAALIDAKRALVLKADWDKGLYRFSEAVKALKEHEGEKASFLSFFKAQCSVKKDPSRGYSVTKRIKVEKCKGRPDERFSISCDEDDTDDDEGLPDLVSADESDTSVEEDAVKKSKETGMPELVDEEFSDTSSVEEDDREHHLFVADPVSTIYRKKPDKKNKMKKFASMLREERAFEVEKAKKEAEKDAEKEAERKREKLEKPKKAKEVDQIDVMVPNLETTQIKDILQEGSKALLENVFEIAAERYGKVLAFQETDHLKFEDIGDYKCVIILYAYGTAMLEMGVQKELEAAKSTFENIITSYKSVDFPLAYYGLGRVYHRQNRFQEAIKQLEKGLYIAEHGSFDPVYWPETDVVIEETKGKNLKVAFEKILTICKYPPKPDAICRFDSCNGLKKNIYFSDPDYKGYVRIMCNDSCLVEYHVHCWKRLKSQYSEKSTDRDFLDCDCFTVDCTGHIMTIQVYGAEGLITEFHSEKSKVRKDLKLERKVSMETTGASKRKKRSKKGRTEFVLEREFSNEMLSKPDSHEVNGEEHVSVEVPAFPEKEEEKNEAQNDSKPENNSKAEINYKSENISKSESNFKSENPKDGSKIQDSPMFVLKKTNEEETSQLTKQGKGKNKKKKKNIIQSLDEFLGRDNEHSRQRPPYYDDEDYDEIPSEPFTRQPPSGWMSNNPFTIPPHLQHEAQAIESSFSVYSSYDNVYRSDDQWPTDTFKELIYSSFVQFLKVQGPLHIDSQPMLHNLGSLPIEAQKLVEQEGGLREFLLRSSLFTIELDIVTNLEDKLFTNMSKSNKKLEPDTFNVSERKNGFTAQKDFDISSFMVNQAGNVEPSALNELKHDSMDSLSNIEDVSLLNNGFKTEFPGLSCDEGIEKSGVLDNNNTSENEDESAEKTDKVVKWLETTKNNKLNFYDEQSIPKMQSKNEASLGNGYLEEENALSSFVDGVADGSVKTAEEALENEQKVTNDASVDPVFSDNFLGTSSMEKSSSEKALTNIPNKLKKLSDLNVRINKPKVVEQGVYLADAKCTKDKGIEAKPAMKSKASMTEPLPEPFKAEYEKLFQDNEGCSSRLQEALTKNHEIQEKYNYNLLNLNKKIKEQSNQKQDFTKKCEELESRQKNAVEVLEQENHKQLEQIKKLQEQVKVKAEIVDRRDRLLEAKIAELQSSLNKEEELKKRADENVSKFKAFAHQQVERAIKGEVQFLELQRDVNFGFFSRALQEGEATLRNVAQILAVNPSQQLHEISQKWQRYVTECKQQISHNKTQFDTFIPKLREGKPLATLTSLRIAHPGPYPCPPILHLPPGSVPPVNKHIPTPLVAGVRPEPVRVPSPVLHVAPMVRPAGLRSLVPQAAPVQPTPSAIHFEKQASIPRAQNLRPTIEPVQKTPNSFEKIMLRLSTLFPNYSRTQMTNFIKEVRASKNGSLTGLSFDDIVACVTQLVKVRESKFSQNTVLPASNEPKQGAVMPDAAPFGVAVALAPPPSFATVSNSSGGAEMAQVFQDQSSGDIAYEEDPCVICHDEMTATTRNVSLDCGHRFHHVCIKKWLTGEQSTCPTCRVHALLPEEFPQLK